MGLTDGNLEGLIGGGNLGEGFTNLVGLMTTYMIKALSYVTDQRLKK